jgi:acetolactate synthase-1/2/3 large subunit
MAWLQRRDMQAAAGRVGQHALVAQQLQCLLDALGAVYLDTGESRGLVSEDHPSVVAAMRGAVMGEVEWC